jgi:hypothetical protein
MAKIVKLESLLNTLERRFFSETQLSADPALVVEGWERRFTTDVQRVEEVIELYSQLGYEVRAVPVPSEEVHEDCSDCHLVMARNFRTIYTRRKAC